MATVCKTIYSYGEPLHTAATTAHAVDCRPYSFWPFSNFFLSADSQGPLGRCDVIILATMGVRLKP